MLSLSLSDRTKEYGSQDIPNWILHDFDSVIAYIPSQVRNSAVTDKQRNAFASLTVGFRPHKSLDISASLFLSQKQKDIVTHSLQHRIENQRDISMLEFDGRIAAELQSEDRGRKNLRIVSVGVLIKLIALHWDSTLIGVAPNGEWLVFLDIEQMTVSTSHLPNPPFLRRIALLGTMPDVMAA